MPPLVQNRAKLEKNDTKCEKSDAKYPVICFSFFIFHEHFKLFCDKCIVSLKPATNDSQEVSKTQKTCKMEESREKKGCVQDNTKIDYTLFTIRLFSCTIKFYPLREKISLSRA